MNDWPEVSQADLHALLTAYGGSALLYFYSPWCAPCLAITPSLRDIAISYASRIRLARVDTDANPSMSAEHDVEDIPTLILFKSGIEIARTVGFAARPALIRWIEESLQRTNRS